MHTTLNKIRSHHPCEGGWKKLLRHLGKTTADDEPLPLLAVLDSNGVEDAIWCLRAVEGYDREIRLFAIHCARQVSHLLKDPRSLEALDVAEAFANGQATLEDLEQARRAAYAAYATHTTADMRSKAAAAAYAAAYANAAYAAVYAAADATATTARQATRKAQEQVLRALLCPPQPSQ